MPQIVEAMFLNPVLCEYALESAGNGVSEQWRPFRFAEHEVPTTLPSFPYPGPLNVLPKLGEGDARYGTTEQPDIMLRLTTSVVQCVDV